MHHAPHRDGGSVCRFEGTAVLSNRAITIDLMVDCLECGVLWGMLRRCVENCWVVNSNHFRGGRPGPRISTFFGPRWLLRKKKTADVKFSCFEVRILEILGISYRRRRCMSLGVQVYCHSCRGDHLLCPSRNVSGQDIDVLAFHLRLDATRCL